MKYMIQLLLWGFTFLSCSKKTEFIYLPPIATENTATGKQLICDTTIAAGSVWDGGGKTFRNNDFKVHGYGTMQNWILDLPITQNIFDSSINFKIIKTYDGRFSSIWMGVNSANTDNWWNIQKSINICRDNNLICFTPGLGDYRYSKTLDFSIKNTAGQYQQTYITFIGDGTYWHPGTTFQYTGTTGPAMNAQLNKGSVFANFEIKGLWQSPGGVDSVYYRRTEAQYTDVSGLNLPDTYTGFAIDYYFDGISRSGSTGIHMTDVIIGGFARGLAFSANGWTQNDDGNIIDNPHFRQCKWCIITGQPQEKGTRITNLYCWDACYNVFKDFGAGNYYMTGANIAGRTVELVQASIGRWFSCDIHSWFSESVGRVCNISAAMPFSFEDCNFDLNTYDKNRYIIISNSTWITFTRCNFRYYDGTGGNIVLHGTALFDKCNFYINSLVNK